MLAVADMATAMGLDGIIATNTTISREGLRSDAAAVESAGAGGLSGAPLRERSTDVIRMLRDRVGPDLALIGVGGISSAEDAHARLEAGADLLQAYTGFIYGGPLWPRRINSALCSKAGSTVRLATMTGSLTPFGARLREAMDLRGPLCAGIDPHAGLLEEWGLTDSVNGLEKFALGAVEALAPTVAAVKPQSAFFERHGSRGVAVLEQVIATAREAGAQVVLDVKRGDIGSTAEAYADAYLDPNSPLAADAITASPFLGFGSLTPMIEMAARHGAGVFVLALTSNKEGPEVQSARASDGRTVASVVLDELRAANADAGPMGSFGAVVGATVDVPDEDLNINGPLLVPGFGAQGGTEADLRRIFGGVLHLVLPSSSRGLLRAGPGRRGPAPGGRADHRLADRHAEPVVRLVAAPC